MSFVKRPRSSVRLKTFSEFITLSGGTERTSRFRIFQNTTPEIQTFHQMHDKSWHWKSYVENVQSWIEKGAYLQPGTYACGG